MTGRPTQWCPHWDGRHYADQHAHHRAFDAWFLAGWHLPADARVLDVGCGDGAFTRRVAELVGSGSVIGLDASESMLTEARAGAGTNQSFVHGPAQDLDDLLGDEPPLDVIISRAALHWVAESQHPGILAAMHRRLKPGGTLRLEFGGGDNVARMVATLDQISVGLGGPTAPWTFLEAGRYLGLVTAAGFSVDGGWVRTVAQRRSFDRDSLAGWLTSQCLQAYTTSCDAAFAGAFEASVLSRLDDLRADDGSYDQIFVRLDVLARA